MDDWYFPRAELAEKYFQILEVGISTSLAVIAPRRKGKTLFILNDIATLAKQKGFIPIYASLWQNINAPHDGLILALEEVLAAISKKSTLSNIFNTKIKKAALGNEILGKVEMEFADEPKTTRKIKI